MKKIKLNSIFYTEVNFSLSPLEEIFLRFAYMPIVGTKGIGLYYLLYSFQNIYLNSECFELNDILDLSNLNELDFIDTKNKLEAIGLLKTYFSETENSAKYIFSIFPPKTPEQFFNNPLFEQLLSKNISQRLLSSLKHHFIKKEFDKENFLDCSKKYKEVYSFNTNKDFDFTKNLIDQKQIDITREFNETIFFKELEKFFISRDDIPLKDLNEAKRISLLYGIPEDNTAYIFYESFVNENDIKYLDYDHFKNNALIGIQTSLLGNQGQLITKDDFLSGSDTVLVQKIKIIENSSPRKYLEMFTPGKKISKISLSLLEELSSEYQLNNPFINLVIDYTLLNCDNNLNGNYARKIAETINRNNFTSVYEGLNYFFTGFSKAKKKEKARKIIDDSVLVDEENGDILEETADILKSFSRGKDE